MRNEKLVDEILDQVTDKYFEWLEMTEITGGDASYLMCRILTQMLINEQEEKDHLKKELYRCRNQIRDLSLMTSSTLSKVPLNGWKPGAQK